MDEFETINSLKNKEEKDKKFKEFYEKTVKINSWLNINNKTSIIKFKDRTEYKVFNRYHRINGPAIDYNDESLNKYYYKGFMFNSRIEWEKYTIKEIRKIKIKNLNSKN